MGSPASYVPVCTFKKCPLLGRQLATLHSTNIVSLFSSGGKAGLLLAHHAGTAPFRTERDVGETGISLVTTQVNMS